MLGEGDDFQSDVAEEIDQEAGLIGVHGIGEAADGVIAFSDFGIETLTDLIEIHRENQSRPSPSTRPI
jgi:hypothetical protein